MYRREPGEAVQRRPIFRRVRLAALGVHAAELLDPLLQALLRVRVRVSVRVSLRLGLRLGFGSGLGSGIGLPAA